MFGEYIKKYRIENGLTQADLATRLAVSQNAISHYEKGTRHPPISRLAPIAKALGVPVSALVSEAAPEQKERLT